MTWTVLWKTQMIHLTQNEKYLSGPVFVTEKEFTMDALFPTCSHTHPLQAQMAMLMDATRQLKGR